MLRSSSRTVIRNVLKAQRASIFTTSTNVNSAWSSQAVHKVRFGLGESQANRASGSLRSFHSSAMRSMAEIPFKLADIGEGIAEVEVLQWFIKEGDTIEQFQNVCEVQSDKATVEITSRYDGVVKKIHYEVGQLAAVGSTLIDIEVDDSIAEASGTSSEKSASKQVEKNPSSTSAKAAVTAPSKPVSATSNVLDVPEPSKVSLKPLKRTSTDTKVEATPSVRRLASEHGIDIQTVAGSGHSGRVLKGDLLNVIKANTLEKMELAGKENESNSSSSSLSSSVPEGLLKYVPSGEYLEQDTVVPVKGIQRLMVKSMTDSLRVPHFGYADEIEMDALHELRESLKGKAKEQGISLSYLPFILKAASLALRQYPSLNAHLNEDATELTMVADHNIAIAMDTPRGLLVPNVKQIQNKSVMEIAADICNLQRLGQANKLGEAELSGGTFSLSNIGSVGGTYMHPVIMVPQVAIGAIGKIQRLPRFDEDDEVVAVRVMNVSWSGDHRVVDGATMARFSNQWKEYVENPHLMLSEMV